MNTCQIACKNKACYFDSIIMFSSLGTERVSRATDDCRRVTPEQVDDGGDEGRDAGAHWTAA